ncbi:MAG: serine/threonine-protein phosphatase [Deltaproteobacteria bacterium]|nr:serine/threonine-protein phosphatase [Deltaproteobacteria bacterium]
MRIVAWGLSDTGLNASDLQLYAVADGMGGHQAGDRASQMAVSILEEELRHADLDGASRAGLDVDEAPGRCLQAAVRTASAKIYEEAEQDPSAKGMGTTLTSLLISGGRAHLAHVGDSRCYLYRDGRLEQLTMDHSWIEEQVRAGFMSRAEAEQSALKHVVTRSVGFEGEVDVDVMVMPTLMGDCFLLCSDGLSNYLNERQLRDYLERGYYSEVPRRLVDTANALGGDDNITVLVVYVANHRPALDERSPSA